MTSDNDRMVDGDRNRYRHEIEDLLADIGQLQRERDAECEHGRRLRLMYEDVVVKLQATEAENARLRRLVTEHHVFGVMDGLLAGQWCPVCARDRAALETESRP
jgi:hypothetical protein